MSAACECWVGGVRLQLAPDAGLQDLLCTALSLVTSSSAVVAQLTEFLPVGDVEALFGALYLLRQAEMALSAAQLNSAQAAAAQAAGWRARQ